MQVMRKPMIALVIVACASVLAACGSSGGSSSGSKPNVTVGYFSGGVGAPETIIGSDQTLQKGISAQLKFTPITAGLAALSEMRAGAFGIVSEVGNPPVVSSTAGATKLKVIW